MALEQILQVWKHDLPTNQQAIALAYADHANEDGTGMWPGTDRIAWKTGYTRRSVQRIRKEMCKAGYLVKVNDATSRRPAEYRFDWSKADEKPPFRSDEGRNSDTPTDEGEGRNSDTPGASPTSPQGRNSDTSRGDEITPEPSVNRHTTPNQPARDETSSNGDSRASSDDRVKGWGDEEKQTAKRMHALDVKTDTIVHLVNEHGIEKIKPQLRRYEIDQAANRDVGPGLLVHWIRKDEPVPDSYRRRVRSTYQAETDEGGQPPADQLPDWRSILENANRRKAQRQAGELEENNSPPDSSTTKPTSE